MTCALIHVPPDAGCHRSISSVGTRPFLESKSSGCRRIVGNPRRSPHTVVCSMVSTFLLFSLFCADDDDAATHFNRLTGVSSPCSFHSRTHAWHLSFPHTICFVRPMTMQRPISTVSLECLHRVAFDSSSVPMCSRPHRRCRRP